MEKFSVLMSVYKNEKPKCMKECFESLLSQSLPANEWVIVEDGPLTQELYDMLDEYENKYSPLIKRVPFATNRGLGLALRDGVIACSNDLIARMDTDDISRSDRFEIQMLEFDKDKTLDVCGSHIVEFENSIGNVVSKRTVPLTDKDIKKYQKKRDAFNHVSVMFKKTAVLKAGNYQSCLLMEDTLLWVNMILSGAKCKNVDDSLVYVRIGDDMFERRGGLDYYKKYKQGRKRIRQTGYISFWDYHYTLFVQFIVAFLPNKLRGFIFKKLLHR